MSQVFEVNVDASKALMVLVNGQKKIPWVITNALNRTGELAQIAVRDRVARIFHIRKAFTLREAAILRKASVPRQVQEVSLSVGNKPRFLLGQFEAGAMRGPFTPGAANVAIPIGARPGVTAPVTPSLEYKALRLRRVGARRRGKGGTGPIEGLMRSFVVPGVGVFQRIAGMADRLLYLFKKAVRLTPRLEFVKTVKTVIDRNFYSDLAKQVDDAFKHAFTSAMWGGGR